MSESQSYIREFLAGVIAMVLGFAGWIVKKFNSKVSMDLFRESAKRHDDSHDNISKQLDRIEDNIKEICKPNSERKK